MVRYKNRYFVTEYSFCGGVKPVINKTELLKLIEVEVERLHGDFGVAAIRYGFDIKYLNPRTNIAVIRSRHGPHKLVGSALPVIQNPLTFKTLRLTATILQAFKFVKNYQLHNLEKYWHKTSQKNLSSKEIKDLEGLQDFNYFKKIDMYNK